MTPKALLLCPLWIGSGTTISLIRDLVSIPDNFRSKSNDEYQLQFGANWELGVVYVSYTRKEVGLK